MKTRRKRIGIVLCSLALVMMMGSAAWAYFSDYDQAIGVARLHMQGQTRIHEDVSGTEKNITIENVGDTSVVVRVAIYGPLEDKNLKVTLTKDWEKHGDYYYYKHLLAPGANTGDAINAAVQLSEKEAAELGDSFTVTVIHESAMPKFNASGVAQKPDGWDYIPTIKQ